MCDTWISKHPPGALVAQPGPGSLPIVSLEVGPRAVCDAQAHPRQTFIPHSSMALSLSSKRLSSLSCISDANSNPISKRRRHKHGHQLRKMSERVGGERMAKDPGSSGRPVPLRRSSPSILLGSSSQPQPRTPQSRGPLKLIRLHPPDCTASRLRTQSFLSSHGRALGPCRHLFPQGSA